MDYTLRFHRTSTSHVDLKRYVAYHHLQRDARPIDEIVCNLPSVSPSVHKDSFRRNPFGKIDSAVRLAFHSTLIFTLPHAAELLISKKITNKIIGSVFPKGSPRDDFVPTRRDFVTSHKVISSCLSPLERK